MNTVQVLLQSRAFLVAVWALVAAILSWAAPNMPREIRAALDSLVAVVIMTIAVNDSRETSKQLKANSAAELDAFEMRIAEEDPPEWSLPAAERAALSKRRAEEAQK